MVQAGGSIAISGLPANLNVTAPLEGRARSFDFYTVTYAPTGEQIECFPAYSAGLEKHLFRHPDDDEWHLTDTPFDAADHDCYAYITAGGDPVPMGKRALEVWDGDTFVDTELTAREIA